MSEGSSPIYIIFERQVLKVYSIGPASHTHIGQLFVCGCEICARRPVCVCVVPAAWCRRAMWERERERGRFEEKRIVGLRPNAKVSWWQIDRAFGP